MKKILFLSFALLLFLSLPSASFAKDGRCYGIYAGDDSFYRNITDRTALYGKAPCTTILFWDWNPQSFASSSLVEIWRAGSMPFLTLEPWNPTTKKGIPLSDIAAGRQDLVLKKLAATLSGFAKPVLIRFGHEMNGNWYPWSGYSNAKRPSDYVAAYKHVHDYLNKNVRAPIIWVWSINNEDVPNEAWNNSINYFPGEKYADAIGVDGYNWADLRSWSRWKDFSEIFAAKVAFFRQKFPKIPVLISETATAGDGSQRSKWIEDLFASLGEELKDIAVIIWFDVKKEVDWRIGADVRSLKAFQKGVKNYADGSRQNLLELFKVQTR